MNFKSPGRNMSGRPSVCNQYLLGAILSAALAREMRMPPAAPHKTIDPSPFVYNPPDAAGGLATTTRGPQSVSRRPQESSTASSSGSWWSRFLPPSVLVGAASSAVVAAASSCGSCRRRRPADWHDQIVRQLIAQGLTSNAIYFFGKIFIF